MIDTELKPKRRDTDWDAVHRDYRTGKFTQRELAAKYSVTHGAVGKKIRELNWQKDLTEEIRQATNARLAQELVAKEVSTGSQEVASAVSVAAEMNVRVIRGQHARLDVMEDLFIAGAKVAKRLLDEEGDAKESQASVQAMATALSAGKMLTELERKVHKLDAEEEQGQSSLDSLLAQINAST